MRNSGIWTEEVRVWVPYTVSDGVDYGVILPQGRMVTKRVYRHDGCKTNHYVRRVAERCEERSINRRIPQLPF